MPEAKLKSIVSLPAVVLASIIACRSEPAPESESFTTVKVAGTTLSSRPRSSSLRRTPFFNAVLDLKRFLKAFKNIGEISSNQKQFNCTEVKNKESEALLVQIKHQIKHKIT